MASFFAKSSQESQTKDNSKRLLYSDIRKQRAGSIFWHPTCRSCIRFCFGRKWDQLNLPFYHHLLSFQDAICRSKAQRGSTRDFHFIQWYQRRIHSVTWIHACSHPWGSTNLSAPTVRFAKGSSQGWWYCRWKLSTRRGNIVSSLYKPLADKNSRPSYQPIQSLQV